MNITKKHPTIKQIAAVSHVSTQTVSRVINNRPDVSFETQKRVIAAIENLGYKPNITALRLKYGRTYMIGFILPDFSNPFFSNAIKAAHNYIQNSVYSNYELLFYETDGNPEREKKAIDLFCDRQMEGIIIASSASNSIIEHIRQIQKKITIVAIDNQLGNLNIDLVTSDNYLGAYLLTNHLLDLGHVLIAVITGPMNESSSFERLKGYKAALSEHGIPYNKRIISFGNWKKESGFSETIHLLQDKPRPTAIFGFNNSMSLGTLSALKNQGIKVPEEMALVSFDDVEYGDLLNPTLTTTNTSWYELGQAAAKLLLDRITDPTSKPQQYIKLPISLVIRDSCGNKKIPVQQEVLAAQDSPLKESRRRIK